MVILYTKEDNIMDHSIAKSGTGALFQITYCVQAVATGLDNNEYEWR